LSQETKSTILASLGELPNGNVICHGDFHPKNVLITTEGPVIIDWADATLGHPLADVDRRRSEWESVFWPTSLVLARLLEVAKVSRSARL
jgi:aminoglycoside phosphotransferase (APT) family kinase protein